MKENIMSALDEIYQSYRKEGMTHLEAMGSLCDYIDELLKEMWWFQ